jgi:hypothetical protein
LTQPLSADCIKHQRFAPDGKLEKSLTDVYRLRLRSLTSMG